MKIKHLQVATPQGAAGDLLRESQYVFNYTTQAREAEVALAMPRRARSYAGNLLPPIFTMSLPEGFLAERLIQRIAKFERIDDMRLLAVTGQRSIGRLRYDVPGETPRPLQPDIGLQQLLSERATTGLFEHLVDRYMASGISGVQPKVMMPDADKLLDQRATVWQPDIIVKSGGEEYPELAVNEFLCMELARRAGLEVPRFWLSDDGSLFVMERFDLKDGMPLGFEDMTVLMGQAREPTGSYKYRQSYEAIARFIKAFCQEHAAESLQRFFEYVALSVAVRNGDAHLKNFGVLYEHPGMPPKLSPLYDVVTTSAYDDVNMRGGLVTDRTLALKLNKRCTYPDREALLAFGRAICGVPDPAGVVERIGQAMSETLQAHLDRLSPAMARRLQSEWEGGRAAIAPPTLHGRGWEPLTGGDEDTEPSTPSP